MKVKDTSENQKTVIVVEDSNEASVLINGLRTKMEEYESKSFGWRVYRRLVARAEEVAQEGGYPSKFETSRDDASMLKQAIKDEVEMEISGSLKPAHQKRR